jgi:hypothetical protein
LMINKKHTTPSAGDLREFPSILETQAKIPF